MTTTDLADLPDAAATADLPAAGAPARSSSARPSVDGSRSRLRLTFPRVVRSEWLKQQTLPSTRWTLAGLFVAIAGFGVLAALMSTGSATPSDGTGPDFSGEGPLSVVTSGANLGVLLVAVLGTLVGAREYASGMVRTTFAAVPSRLPVLVAKVVAFLGSVVPVVVLGLATAFVGGTAVLENVGSATVALSDDGVLQALAGQVAYLSGIGLLGLAVGSMMRAVAGGLVVVIGGVLFVPALAGALLPDSWSDVLAYLPSNAGTSLTSLTAVPGLLGAGAAAGVLAAWVVGSLGLAAVLLRRRDV